MKKCCMYLDALENKSAENAAAWQDVLMHAGHCPDCASDMRCHGEILEIMSDMPEPEYPTILHSSIMAGITDAAADPEPEPGWLACAFDRLLQPVELAVSVACLVMFVFLMQVDYSSSQSSLRPTRQSAVSTNKLVYRSDQNSSVASQTLEAVSPAEINQFMRQLEEFNRTHRQQRQPAIDYTPELRLVNDLSNRR